MKFNKTFSKCICAFLTLVLSLQFAPVYAVSKTRTVYSENFNSVPVNGIPDGIKSEGEKARVLNSAYGGRVLQVIKGAKTTVTVPLKTDEQKYYIDFKIGAENKANANISVANNGTVCNILKIEDNEIKTKEGKVISGVTANAEIENNTFYGGLTQISIAVNLKSGTYSAYVNRRLCVDDWKISGAVKPDSFIIEKQEDSENDLYIDDIALYEGGFPWKSQSVKKGSYAQSAVSNDENGEEFFSFTDDIGDFTFFHSTWAGQTKYANNVKMYPKTNEITSEEFDYKNPNKGDKLIFRKKTADDAYIDVNLNIFKGYKSKKQYKYFKISGEFSADFDSDPTAQIFMLRDKTSSASVINEYPVKIESGRKVTISGTQGFANAAANGACFKVTMYLNLNDGTNTVFFGTGNGWTYNNYRMVAKNVRLTNKIKNLNVVRIACGSGAFSGELKCRNVEITGFDKPFVVNENDVTEVNTSMFEFDKNIADDLDGKILFDYLSNTAFSNGKKYKLEQKGIYQDGEFYIPIAEFNKAYGKNAELDNDVVKSDGKSFAVTCIKNDNGADLIPLKDAVQKVLGFNVFDDTNGLIVTSKAKIYFDNAKEVPYHKRYTAENTWNDTYRYVDFQSNLQYLSDYMLFDRPSAQSLLDGYNKMNEDGKHHISVLASDKDFDRIRELYKTDAYMKKVADDLIAQADMTLKQKIRTYVYDDSIRMLNTARILESRMQLVGFAYQLTGDGKYAEYALKQLDALENFPDLNPIHIIDSGSFGTAIAVAYDWCYDYFTEAQREKIKANVYRLFLSVFPQAFYCRIPAKSVTNNDLTIVMPSLCLKWYSNFNTWVNSGGVCMAAAFMGDYPEICSDYLSNTIRSLEYTMKNLYPDGVWAESSNYWYHVSRSLMYSCATLENIYGTEFNLLSFPGAEETGIANMAIRGMAANYNYHDAADEKIYASHPMGYLGKHFNQKELLAARRATIEKSFDSRMADVQVFVADALFYDPDVSVDEIEKLPKVKYSEGVELFSVHGDYKDYDALFFVSHGGPTTFYHAHNDNGDFVFDLNGVRWAQALGSEDYNSSLPENEKYRKRPEGHNTVVINNNAEYNQTANAYTPVIDYKEGDGGAYAVYDMTDTYSANVKDYKRGFYIGDNFKTLTVRDEIDLAKDNSEIYWFMHTTADAYVADERTVALSKDGKTMTLRFDTDAPDAEISIMDAVPLPSSPQGEGQTNNVGVRKVAIKLNASGKVNLTVRLGEFAKDADTTPISGWSAPAKSNSAYDMSDYGYSGVVYGEKTDSLAYIPVMSGQKLPDVEIVPNDPEKSAEYIKSDNVNVPNLIKVYNADKTLGKMYIVPYDTQRGTKDLMFDELEIKSSYVSDEPQAENKRENMFDNDFSTRWTTMTRGEYAVFDLGSVQSVDAVAAGFWQSLVRSYYFDLYCSADGVNYEKIDSFTSSPGAEEYQVFGINRVNARYIKLVGNGCSANPNTNILELRILKLNDKFEKIRYGGEE